MYFHDNRQEFQLVQGSAWQDPIAKGKEAQWSWLIFKEIPVSEKKIKGGSTLLTGRQGSITQGQHE